ncbi:DUF2314 domain-containing protein [Chitinophaga nivalis]|uniref:DUF2314 domain-containing protein n=1 Tax=Chitinophaga nivalis TaxID=2991709 RepID=A0ABT3IKD6_9BACT|nr:DUF2314 domain-containing protein [Chitinophaga nivalis]MCW3465887.1 DUF2314 domain-containing protein [Chitinophaga nivalis]MCW3484422.1 DUF2314 domain-containing protein [Chitinophaga nivalis]
MAENEVFFSEAEDPGMLKAFQQAQETFKYFWRELSWEARRIIPALDLACVKVAFSETVADQPEPIVEHMWINDIGFDGETVSGVLVNNPNRLTNVQNGDFVTVPLQQISDWLLASQGKTCGGFTIQHLRAGMEEEERQEHDDAWGLDFGDYQDISVVNGQKEHPENLIEHPMSINMRDSFIQFLQEYPQEATNRDDAGYTLLHKEAIAGNKNAVEVLLQFKADKDSKTNDGKSALDFARQLDWAHIIPLLEK